MENKRIKLWPGLYIILLSPIWIPLAGISFVLGSLCCICAGAFLMGTSIETQKSAPPG